MTTPRKKAPAKKAAPRKRPQARSKQTRPQGKPGPAPAVLRGFDRNIIQARYQDDEVPPDPWTEHAPARRVLLCLRSGATWKLAADYARISYDTVWRWNVQGQEAIAGHDDLMTYASTGVDDETLAKAAFHILATQAFTMPGVGALNTITRSSQSDWRAGLALIRILPQMKADYSEIQKLEHSGPDGEAISVEVRAAALTAKLRNRKVPPPDDGAGDPDDDDRAGEG